MEREDVIFRDVILVRILRRGGGCGSVMCDVGCEGGDEFVVSDVAIDGVKVRLCNHGDRGKVMGENGLVIGGAGDVEGSGESCGRDEFEVAYEVEGPNERGIGAVTGGEEGCLDC